MKTQKLLTLLFLVLLASCGVKESVDSSNDNIEKTNKQIQETQKTLVATQSGIDSLQDEIIELKSLLKETRLTIKDTQQVVLDIIEPIKGLNKTAGVLQGSLAKLDGGINLLHEDMSLLVGGMQDMTKMANKMSKFADDPRFIELFEQILSKDKGLSKVMDQFLELADKVNNCKVEVFLPEYLKEAGEGSLYGREKSSFKTIISAFDGDEYYIIPKDLKQKVHITHKYAITKSGSDCELLSQLGRVQFDRLAKEAAKMIKSMTSETATKKPVVPEDECGISEFSYVPRGRISNADNCVEDDVSFSRIRSEAELNQVNIKNKSNYERYTKNWNDYYNKWNSDRVNIKFTKDTHELLLEGVSTLNAEVSQLRDRIRSELLDQLNSWDGLTGAGKYIFNGEQGPKLRQLLTENIESEFSFDLKPLPKFSDMNELETKIVEQIFTRLYYGPNTSVEKKIIADYFIDFFFLYFDKQFTESRMLYSIRNGLSNNSNDSQELGGQVLIRKKDPISFRTKELNKLKNNLLEFIDLSLESITETYKLETFQKKVDLYHFPHGKKEEDVKLAVNLKYLKEESYDTLSELSIEEINQFEREVKKKGILSEELAEYPSLKKAVSLISHLRGPDKSLVRAVHQAKDKNEVKNLISKSTPNSNLENLIRILLDKGVNSLKKDYIAIQKESDKGKSVSLRVVTLNTFLLYQEPMASDDVYERARLIGKMLGSMSPSPDIILLQEVFPNDTPVTEGEGFLWPKSKDWPMKDVRTILSELERYSGDEFYSAKLGHKQVGSNYQTFSQKLYGQYKNYIKEGTINIAKDQIKNGLNLGPPGLIILAKKKLKGKRMTENFLGFNRMDDAEFKLITKGSFFSRFDRGTKLNAVVPISRGTLTGLFEIEGFGVFDASTTHMTTSEGNDIERMFQIAQSMEEQRERRVAPKNYSIKTFSKLLSIMCTMHPIESCLSEEEIATSSFDKLLVNFKKSKSLWESNKTLSEKDSFEIETYFQTLNNESFKNDYLFGITGGDFNFEPYGNANHASSDRVMTSWPNQLLLADAHNTFSLDVASYYPELVSYDSEENTLARKNKTSPRGQLKDQMDNIVGTITDPAMSKLAESFRDNFLVPGLNKVTSGSEVERKLLDYLVLNSNTQNATKKSRVIAIDKSRLIFREGDDDPSDELQVSDHFGLTMDVKIYAK
jgi:hypothetical protein